MKHAVRDGSLFRHGAFTVSASGVTLIANFGTGVLLARVLGVSGRGATTAIQTSTQVCAWLFLVGSAQTISYFQASESERGGTLLGTWLFLLVPLSILAFVSGELLLPLVMAAQSQHTLAIARAYMATVVLVLLTEMVSGYVLGNKRFVLFNVLRVATPLVVAVVYVVLWRTATLSVSTAVWSFAVVQIGALVIVFGLCVRWHGISKPEWGLAKRTLWYGIRAHSTNISTLLTARLDLLIMPAFLSASSVGLYSVATNVSWIVFALAGSIALIALPIAASAGERGPDEILASLRGTAIVATVLAVLIGLLAHLAVSAVYGEPFTQSVLALRLLLPGSVCYAMALVLVSGLYAANRPFVAAATQGAGLITTVIGLMLFLKSGGINAAAIVSTVSYTLVFAIALVGYRRIAGLAWRDLLRMRCSVH